MGCQWGKVNGTQTIDIAFQLQSHLDSKKI